MPRQSWPSTASAPSTSRWPNAVPGLLLSVLLMVPTFLHPGPQRLSRNPNLERGVPSFSSFCGSSLNNVHVQCLVSEVL